MKRQRKRHPLDVPTPVAVAVADFCRRAGASVEPRTVRDALSLLPADADERVRALCAQAPPARPLGPYAVVDLIEANATPEAVARKQESGAYDDVILEDPPAANPSVSPEGPQQQEPTEGESGPEEAPPKKRRTKKQQMADRIAPVKRDKAPPRAAPAPPPIEKPSAWRKRDLPKGRGRFTNIDSTRARVEKLHEPGRRNELEALAQQHGHRVALRRALEAQYTGKKGTPLTTTDVEVALAQHGLRGVIEASERVLVISAVAEARGELGRARITLGMKLEELEHVALNCGAAAEVARMREHWAREALASGNLKLKLELLEKRRYLDDLGVEKRFHEVLARELIELCDRALKGAHDVDSLLWEASRLAALPYDKLKAAMERIGLSAQYQRKFVT